MTDSELDIKEIKLRLTEALNRSNRVTDPVLLNLVEGSVQAAVIGECAGYLQACEDFGIISPGKYKELRSYFELFLKSRVKLLTKTNRG